MALGTRDTTSLVTLTGWDAAELRKFALADGTTYDQVVAQINIATFHLGREAAGAEAIALVGVDQPLSEPDMAKLKALPQVRYAKLLRF